MSNIIVAFNAEKSLKLVGTVTDGTITGSLYRVTGQRGRPIQVGDTVTLKARDKAGKTFATRVNGTAHTFKQFVKVPGKVGRPKGSKNKPKDEAVAA